MGVHHEKEVKSIKGETVMLYVSFNDMDSFDDPQWDFSVKVWNERHGEYQNITQGWLPQRSSSDIGRIEKVLEYVTTEQILEVQLELWEQMKPKLFTGYNPKEYDEKGQRIK